MSKMTFWMRTIRLMLAASVLVCATIARAQSQAQKPAIYNDVGIDQKLNDQVPLDLAFHDEKGREVKLAEYFGKRPVVLALVYYNCPSLCTMVLNELNNGMNAIPLSAGKEFDVVTVSFDPTETPELAMQKKMNYLRRYQRPTANAGWHFLTGDEASIKRLTESVGFRYTWDKKFQQYVHASGIMVLTPQGKISRYFYGIRYEPRDLRLALTESSEGKISSPVEQLLLYCFHYDPATGKYSLAITRIVQAASIVTLLTIGCFIVVNVRRDRRAAHQTS
jgi:protein SCO1/2